MADVLTDKDDDIIDEGDITIVETATPETLVPTQEPLAKEPVAKEPDDDEDDEDERLGDEEAGDDGLTEKQRKRRVERRQKNEMRKQARLRNEAELQELRALVPNLMQRVQQIESHASTSAHTSLQQQLAQAESDAATALTLHAEAIEAGNGADAARALAIREQALAKASELRTSSQAFQANTAPPARNPQVDRLAQEWVRRNSSWFNPAGNDPASMLVRAIDNQVAAAGFDPATNAYWEEVTARATRALDDAGMLSRPRQSPAATEPPPTGMGREHAPASTKKGVHLSAERVQAMKDAGIWDDPVRRTKQIKAFQEYDRANGSPKQ